MDMHISLITAFEDFKRGNTAAFEHYFNWFKKRLLYFSGTLLQHQDEVAEEIVLDVFVKCWEKRATFSSPENVKAFLYIAVKNACLTYLQSTHHRKCTLQEEYEEDALIAEPEIYAHLIRTDVMAALANEVEKLTPLQQKIVKMSYVEDRKPEEIAHRLQMNPNAVYVNYSRAIKSLKKKMLKKKDWLFSFFL